jgi:hypothetical protein
MTKEEIKAILTELDRRERGELPERCIDVPTSRELCELALDGLKWREQNKAYQSTECPEIEEVARTLSLSEIQTLALEKAIKKHWKD